MSTTVTPAQRFRLFTGPCIGLHIIFMAKSHCRQRCRPTN